MEQGDRNANSSFGCVKRRDSSVLIKKIITLLTHQVTRNDIERQKETIKEFIQMSQDGFWVKDIFNVMHMIELLLDRLYEINDYVELLEGILEIYSIPPKLSIASDVISFVRDLREYFSMLGYLLVCLKIEDLQNSVANALINLLTRDLPNQRWYVPLRNRQICAENSRLPEILGQLLEVGDENIYPKVLQIIILLAKVSMLTRKELIKQDALNSLFTRLEPTWKERYPDKKPSSQPIDNILHYEEFSTIAWMLLKYLDGENEDYLKSIKNITLFSLWNIQYVYRLFVDNKTKCLDTNNMLSMVIKMLQYFPNMEFIKSGLAKDVLLLSRSPLYRKLCSKNIVQTLNYDDYTYMQLLMTILPFYIHFIGGITVLENERIIYRLLSYLINKPVPDFPIAQECTLTWMALEVLGKIVPYMEEDFMENTGPHKLLSCIEKYKAKECDQNILKHCLKTLNHVIRTSTSDIILNSVLFNDGLDIIIDVCNSIIASNDRFRQSCLGFAICLLKTMYKHSSGKSKDVIDMTVTYMKQILHPGLNEPVHDNRIVICIMDFVWEHIVKSERDSVEFVKRKGVFLMLDIVHKFPFAVQIVTLGALVDLCEQGHCVPYLITWRGRDRNILSLFMGLFREENKRLSVKSGPRGQISDTKYPIMGKEQWIQTFCRCIEVNGNPVMADLFVSCRPKIYALLQMLNERYKEEVQLADEHYKLYSGQLRAEDQVTMLLAENFLALKLAEAWLELKTELDTVPVTLIPADNKMISYLIDRSMKWSSYLQEFQNGVLRHAQENDMIEEQKLYNFLEESRLSDALQALNELVYLARCSERMFRVSQKFLQNIQIDASLAAHAGDARPHKTYFSKIQVTPVFNQTLDVESKINKGTEEIVLEPISPTVSDKCEIGMPEDLLTPSSELNCD